MLPLTISPIHFKSHFLYHEIKKKILKLFKPLRNIFEIVLEEKKVNKYVTSQII